MKKNYPFISIIIPTKNEEKFIGNCLESLKNLNYPKDKFEIIISDGMSTDKTVKIAQKYGAKIVKNYKQIVVSGRNIGFRHSRGEIIAFSDADCRMDKNWLNNSLKYFKDEKLAGIGGPSYMPKNETQFGRAVQVLFLIGSFFSGSVQASTLKKVKKTKSIPGCNAIYRRSTLEKVMPIDENLLTCDDTSLNYSLVEKGYKLLYVPDVIVWHYRRDNPLKFFRQIYRYAIGRVQLARKYKNALDFSHILFGFFIPILILLLFVFGFFPVFSFFIFISFVFTIFILLKEKSLSVSLNFILAAVIFLFAWSFGFLKELIFPMKKLSGK